MCEPMTGKIQCPNCGTSMHENESCPECIHTDGDSACDCDYCVPEEYINE